MVKEVKAMGRLRKRRHSYQASPWPPGQVRFEPCKRKSNLACREGEAITCRDRKSRKDAEGHANAEPHY